MRYNANELYIVPQGSVSFWPRMSDGQLQVSIGGRLNLDGIDFNLFRGQVNLEATSPNDLFAIPLNVWGKRASDVNPMYFEVKSNQNMSWYNTQQTTWNEVIRMAVWGAIQSEGGIEQFRKKMTEVYIDEFARDLDGLNDFIRKTRTEFQTAFLAKDDQRINQIINDYYDRVDPEEEIEDD